MAAFRNPDSQRLADELAAEGIGRVIPWDGRRRQVDITREYHAKLLTIFKSWASGDDTATIAKCLGFTRGAVQRWILAEKRRRWRSGERGAPNVTDENNSIDSIGEREGDRQNWRRYLQLRGELPADPEAAHPNNQEAPQ